jgi:hypothetical protein
MRTRVTPRIIVFIAAVVVILGYPLWWFVDLTVSGGIKDRGDYLEVDLKTISSFDMDQANATTADIPERFRQLNGKKVLLVGEMVAKNSIGTNQRDFDLVYSIQKCCFSGPPLIQHFVKSTVARGVTAPYQPGRVRAMGILNVGVERDKETGEILSVYRFEVQNVEPG